MFSPIFQIHQSKFLQTLGSDYRRQFII